MSIPNQKVSTHLTGGNEASNGAEPPPPARRKREVPYRPKLATTTKWALEDMMKNAERMRNSLLKLLKWQDRLDARLAALLEKIEALGPDNPQVPALKLEVMAVRVEIGEARAAIAEIMYEATEIERTLNHTLNSARRAVAPPKERMGHDGDGDDGGHSQQTRGGPSS